MASNSEEIASEPRDDIVNLFNEITDEEEAWELAWNFHSTSKSSPKIAELLSFLLIGDDSETLRNRELCRDFLAKKRLENNLVIDLVSDSNSEETIKLNYDEVVERVVPSLKRSRELQSSENVSESTRRMMHVPKKVVFEKIGIAQNEDNLQMPINEMQSLLVSNKEVATQTNFEIENEIAKTKRKIVAVNTFLKFKRKVGSGAEGTVNDYLDTFSGKRFAIKQIPIKGDFAKFDINEVLHLYKRESDILSQLDSKGLFTECINVFKSSELIYSSKEFKDFRGPSFCIQMPLYATTIDNLVLKLRNMPKLPFNRILESEKSNDTFRNTFGLWFISVLMQEVFDAVEIMHDNNFVHRDLKSSNILVSFQGTHNIVKVGDFGFARPLTNLETVAQSTNLAFCTFGEGTEETEKEPSYLLSSKKIGGTPLFRAPNVEEEREFRQRDDIYSLGLLYFELIWRYACNPVNSEVIKAIQAIKINELTASDYLPCLDQFASPIVSQLIELMIDLESKRRPCIREVKKLNLVIRYLSSFFLFDVPTENDNKAFGRQLLKTFLSPLIGSSNSLLVEHYQRIYDTNLSAVLDEMNSLNAKIRHNSKKAALKDCRINPTKIPKLNEMTQSHNFLDGKEELDDTDKYFVWTNGKFVQVKESGFLVSVGHHLEDTFEKSFLENSALVDFGELQAIVSDPCDENLTFDALIANSNELLLERWNKVSLLGARWFGFEAFLRHIIDVKGFKRKFDKDHKEFIAKLWTCQDVVSFVSTINCNLLDLGHSEIAWKSLFAASTKGFRGQGVLQHRFEFAMIIRDLYNFFYRDFCQIPISKSSSLYNFEGRKEFSESFIFARFALYQIETALLDETNREWLKKVLIFQSKESDHFLEGLKGFFEKRSRQVEKLKFSLQNLKKFVDLSKAKVKPEDELNADKETEIDLLIPSQSLFTVLSSKLFDTNHLRIILKIFTLTEALKNHFQYKTKTANFIHFLIFLIFVDHSESQINKFIKEIMGQIEDANYSELVNEIIDLNF